MEKARAQDTASIKKSGRLEPSCNGREDPDRKEGHCGPGPCDKQDN